MQALNFAESANLSSPTQRNCDSLITSFQPPLTRRIAQLLSQLSVAGQPQLFIYGCSLNIWCSALNCCIGKLRRGFRTLVLHIHGSCTIVACVHAALFLYSEIEDQKSSSNTLVGYGKATCSDNDPKAIYIRQLGLGVQNLINSLQKTVALVQPYAHLGYLSCMLRIPRNDMSLQRMITPEEVPQQTF